MLVSCIFNVFVSQVDVICSERYKSDQVSTAPHLFLTPSPSTSPAAVLPVNVKQLHIEASSSMVRGISVHDWAVYVVHYGCPDLFVYHITKGELITKVAVPDLVCPEGMTAVTSGHQGTVIITDCPLGGPFSLHWVHLSQTMNNISGITARRQSLDYWPYGVCVDEEKSTVIVCGGDYALHIYDITGTPLCMITTPKDVNPRRVTAHNDRYAISTANNQLIWMDGEGTITKVLSPDDTTWMTWPVDILMDTSGQLLVADCHQDSVALLTQQGDHLCNVVQTDIIRPMSIAFDCSHQRLCVGHGADNHHSITVIEYQITMSTEEYPSHLKNVTKHISLKLQLPVRSKVL